MEQLPGDYLFTGKPLESPCLRRTVEAAIATPMAERSTAQLGAPTEREISDDGSGGERLTYACGVTGCGACIKVYPELEGTGSDQPQFSLSAGQVTKLGKACPETRVPRTTSKSRSSFR